MNRKLLHIPLLALLCASLSACASSTEKNASLTILYTITTGLSLVLLICYLLCIRPRQLWFGLLFSSVFVVNLGYLFLSISSTLEAALWANRLAYLGSVFLPLAMLMIILSLTELRIFRRVPLALLLLGLVMFCIAASPGWLPIYYKTVTLEIVNGVSLLRKEYGPFHNLYTYYLVLYFGAMIAVIVHASVKKKLTAPTHAVLLCSAVGINIGVWLLEKLIPTSFELLSLSYIFTELFLIGLHMLLQEQARNAAPAVAIQAETTQESASVSPEQCRFYLAHLPLLTPTERIILDLYLDGKSSKDILVDQHIKENTLKYHNRNIYNKLGVTSRKQLLQIAAAVQSKK